jgi:hypothetical protein
VIVSLLGFLASIKQVVRVIRRWIQEQEKD